MKKGILILILLILALFSVSNIYAADVNDTLAASEDTGEIELSHEMESADNNLGTIEEQTVTQTDNEEKTGETDDGSFRALEYKIYSASSGDTIYLENNYSAEDSWTVEEGILISTSNLVIDGQGHTIDAKQKTRIFRIYQAENVTIKNITFTNGKITGYGGAIYWTGDNGTVIGCAFTNNKAEGDYPNGQGGAICWTGANGTVTNTAFSNNTANIGGGAILWFGANGAVTDTTFSNNTATYQGGAISWGGDNGAVTNTSFSNNTANLGGAIYWDGNNGAVTNSYFTNNTANYDGGAIECWGDNGRVTSSIFINNTAKNGNGGAIDWYGSANGNISDCAFINNTASEGRAIYISRSSASLDRNWFGNTAENYETSPNAYIYGAVPDNWLFLNATVAPNPISIAETADIIFKLYLYNGSITDYTSLAKVDLTMNSNGKLDKNVTGLDEKVTFTPTSLGTGSVTATIGDVAYTTTLTVTDGTTFWDLNKTINGNTNDTITLDNDYAYNQTTDSAFTEGIMITRPVTINGNGHTIDAKGQTRILLVICDNVNINNVTFVKGKCDGNGGAINWHGANGAVSGSSFIGNNANWDGGAIYWYGANGAVSDCIFLNNTAGAWGVIYAYCNDLNMNHCWFGNTADNYDSSPAIGGYSSYDNWLFLNATANPDAIAVSETSDIIFKLFLYNSTSGNITEYDNAPFENLNLTIASTNGDVSKNTAKLGEIIKYDATNIGTGSVTASVENVAYTIELNIKYRPDLLVQPQEVNYGSNTVITLDYNSTATGTVNITLKGKNGNNYTFTDLTLNATILLPEAINADEYEVNVTYSGDNAFWNATANGTLTVNKLKTELTASAVTTTYNINKDLVITLKDSTGKALSGFKVTVDLNGAKTYTTDKNGQVKVSTKGLAPKAYTAKITFNGNTNYDKSTKDVKVTIKKATPKLTAKKKTFKSSVKTKKYTITLKDNTGKAIKKAKVTLKVKGKTYNATTNSKGKAVFKIKKLNKKGTFKATITYKGNKYYNKITKKANIKVIVTFKTVSKGSKDKATVKEIQKALKNKGYYLTYQGHYLKVDGKFSSCTFRSVKEFQKDKGLKVTGKVDEKTAKKLGII